ncbi:hypothetical protein L3X38_011550 [Prunus dulcis]|uniref:Uncharacterized protein n=1 Tax=Prunus dulcis TaxID=3755 RepID=A0AAD4ZF83_PRUDU|nr:hypothetical protein L3X38_011550 [Prunus dulcis]
MLPIDKSIIREEIAIVTQLRYANATAIWYFWDSSPKLQWLKSLKYNIVMPAEAKATARDSVAVTCWKRNQDKKWRVMHQEMLKSAS